MGILHPGVPPTSIVSTGRPLAQVSIISASPEREGAFAESMTVSWGVDHGMGQFRRCYQSALDKNEKLRGRVKANFVIDEKGKVAKVSDAGSDIPDATVTACVLRALTELSFPAPVGGRVNARANIVFFSRD